MNRVTIIPPEAPAGELTKTQGTQVLLEDGSKLDGVTRIVLTCAVGDVWRAQIDVMPHMGPIPGVLATINRGAKPAWWRRALCRLAGVDIVATREDRAERAQLAVRAVNAMNTMKEMADRMRAKAAG